MAVDFYNKMQGQTHRAVYTEAQQEERRKARNAILAKYGESDPHVARELIDMLDLRDRTPV